MRAADLAPATRAEPLWDLSFIPGWAVVLIIVGIFVTLFTAIYFLVCFITAARGWMSYGSRYRSEFEFPANAQNFGAQSMMIGGNIAPANYRHAVTVGLSEDGIHLRMGTFFKSFHPPLFVPWDAVERVSQEKAIKGVYTAVNVKQMPRLVFFKGLGDTLFAQWQARQ